MSRLLRAALGLLFFTLTLRAEHYRFKHYGREDGISTGVTQLLQDRTGFLWVATTNGLFRYDGARFLPFGAEAGLTSNWIRNLHQSANGTLWVVTSGGLERQNGALFESVATGAQTDFSAIGSGAGKLYLGYDHGLLAANLTPGGEAMRFQPVPGAPSEPVNGIYVEPNGDVWFSCGVRLCRLQQNLLRVFDQADGLPPEKWGILLRDPHGSLWLRGPEHVSVLPSGAQEFVPRDRGLPQSSNTILAMMADRDGKILVGTDLGLARWEDGRWRLTGTAQGLESDTVTALLQDREGSIWIGLWGAGVARWPGYGEWTGWTTQDGLTNNIIWSVQRDRSGALWVGTDHGLVRMESDSVRQRWTRQNGLSGDKSSPL